MNNSNETRSDNIKEFSSKTPFDATETANNAHQLLAIGKVAGEVIPQMKALGDAALDMWVFKP